MSHHVFRDLKIIELAGVLAGPSVGYFFAELGATVIKIENPKTNGDVTRSWKLKTENPKDDGSAYFWSVNAFKEFISLDISSPSQLQKLYELVKDADIIVTNFKNGDEEKLKVDYLTLSKINPELIYASINGFGSDSPRSAYDLILQAESGFMFMNGEPNSKPVKMPVAFIDLLAGHQLKEAILIALIDLYKNKKGSHVSVSLFDSAIASLANQATNWLIGGHMPKAMGSLHPNIAPYGELFDTKDNHQVTFAIGSNKQFKQLCEMIQFPTLASDPKYATNQLRVVNRIQLYHIIYNYIKQFNFKDLYNLCLEKEIPIGKIRNLKEVFELPEAKAMMKEFTFSKKKIPVVSGIAFKFHT
ncbi:MAG: L-carnitine dehydratase/bile acid-inducible protein [Bacteroidetes bacterium]|jgi:crotonobetainyl-CoA:carnitine CoA-transferase CaiB-like acyl-CoA transferase|nr:L-carnitine dehydratase/bile acid-inducible protein [Bacteroidota bacterium]